jgi:outer membrane PBP1 activator LpoA protein
VISTNIPWQRRAASAFAAQWEKQGRELEPIELVSYNGYLGARELVQLKEQLEFDKPGLLFAALDEKQAKQLRIAVGNEIPLYGTSQLNPFSFSDWSTAERSMEMDGIRLLDIPWQLQADHPAVMVYPRLAGNADQKPSADLERLYALGIDAYRVAREIASKRTSFELDGVTGKLKVNFDTEAPVFQRTEQQAVYRRGSVMAVTDPR